MKSVYIILYSQLLAICFIIAGCSSTYTVKDFTSNDQFHQDFNNSVRDKVVNVILTNDSSFVSPNGTKIDNDTLHLTKIISTGQRLNITEIDSINYFDNNLSSPFARLYLKNKMLLNTDIFMRLPDSSLVVHPVTIEKLPLSNVREIYYTNRWLGIPGLLLFGAAAGFVIRAYIAGSYNLDQEINYNTRTFLYKYSIPVGAIIGGIVGLITGYKYKYLFNPDSK